MILNLPDLTSEQFGQIVFRAVSENNAPGAAAEHVVVVKHMAEGLARGVLKIVAAHSPVEAQEPAVEVTHD